MSDAESFEKRLKSSGALQSLELEYEVGRILQTQNWQIAHGAFYLDPIEKKPRELDVRGRQVWIKGETGLFQYEFLCRIGLLVECKTITGYHLVFPSIFPSDLPVDIVRSHRYWVGEDHTLQNRLRLSLVERAVDADRIDQLITSLPTISHPDETALIHDIAPPPPPASFIASTFAETNTKNDKELDSSVLWRATSVLRSAGTAVEDRAREASFEWLAGDLEGRSRATTKDLNGILASWNRQCRELDIWHHVVVVRSDLWTLSGGELTSADWVRLVRIEEPGWCDSWCDIVRFDTADLYFRTLSSHYSDFLGHVGFVLHGKSS